MRADVEVRQADGRAEITLSDIGHSDLNWHLSNLLVIEAVIVRVISMDGHLANI